MQRFNLEQRLNHFPCRLAGPTAPLSFGALAATSSCCSSSFSASEFLKQNKRALEKRIGNVRPLLSALHDAGIVTEEEQEEVQSKGTRAEKNTALLAMVNRKGTKAQEALYKALTEEDRALVEDLHGVIQTVSTCLQVYYLLQCFLISIYLTGNKLMLRLLSGKAIALKPVS